MAEQLKIDVKVNMTVDEKTARTALAVLELYCNASGFVPVVRKDYNGEIVLSLEPDATAPEKWGV